MGDIQDGKRFRESKMPVRVLEDLRWTIDFKRRHHRYIWASNPWVEARRACKRHGLTEFGGFRQREYGHRLAKDAVGHCLEFERESRETLQVF